MTKSNKKRAGLQKKVSSVFEGVPIPGSKREDRSRRMPSRQRSAASPLPKPSDSQIRQDPVITRLDQPEESVDRSVPAHFTASLPSMSTNHVSPRSPEVERIDRLKESVDKIALEYMTATTLPTSTDSEDPQDPDTGRIDQLEEIVERTVPEYMAAVTPPTSTDSEDPQDPDTERIDQPEEIVERTVPEYMAAVTPPTSTDSEDPQDPDAGRIDQPEESVDETVSARIGALPSPKPAERESSQSSLIRRMAECEEPPLKPAPVRTEEASREPASVKTVRSSRKPAPAEQSPSNPFAETSGPSISQQIRDKLATSSLGTGTAKDKVMVILVPILAIVMIFMFKQVLHKSPGKAKGAAKDDTRAVVTANAGDEIKWELPKPMPALMRDPTKLPSQGDTQSPASDSTQKPKQNRASSKTLITAMRIKSLVYSENKSSVVIGNTIAHVGDKIDGVTIAGISKDSVEFEKDGKTWVQKVRD